MNQFDRIDGSYGFMAVRKEDRRFWKCWDSDYSWTAVVDDFGYLVTVSSYTNIRGY